MNSEADEQHGKALPTSDGELGTRLSAVIDRVGSRQKASSIAGRSTDQLWKYVRGTAEPPFVALARLCLATGTSMEWLATGLESEKPLQDKASGQKEAAPSASQPMRSEDLTLAIQLAEEALDGKRLEPADYAQLVMLIHGALVNGLPSAQVLAFARPASRGLRGKDDGSAVGGSGQGAAGAR